MRHLSILLALLAAFPLSADAQDDRPQPDTLDWHGYFPLAIGKVWQYRFEIMHLPFIMSVWYERWHVSADTSIARKNYFVVSTVCDSVYTPEGARINFTLEYRGGMLIHTDAGSGFS